MVTPPSPPPAWVADHTRVVAPPLVPELRLHTATEVTSLWQATEDRLDRAGLPPPFWAFPWAGGQALARFVLDHPDWVRGRRVIDLASGNGMVAIACARAGAAHVTANDVDPLAAAAQQANAVLNGVAVTIETADRIGDRLTRIDLLVAGDLFYERALAERLWPWLQGVAKGGLPVLVGDPGRTYLPKTGLTALARYAVPVPLDLEDREVLDTTVWRVGTDRRG